MVSNLLLVLSLAGLALGLLACSILFFSNKTLRLANHLLALSLLGLVFVMLMTFLMQWNLDYYAYIYRFPSPFYYLIMPCAYLYVRTVVQDESRLRKSDAVHFLPALLHFLEMLPFYFSSYAFRKALVHEMVHDPNRLLAQNEGVLPAYYHTMICSLLGLVYAILIIKLLRKARATSYGKVHVIDTASYNWLQTYAILLGLIALPMAFIFFTSPSIFISDTEFLLITITVCFLVINLHLFLRPDILYGIPHQQLPVRNKKNSNVEWNLEEHNPAVNQDRADETEKEKKEEFSLLANLETYKPVLETYMENSKPFLKQGYTIHDLSRDTGIPQHHLSALFNRRYKMRFTEFMNRERIDYIRNNFGNPEWDKLTLEGIAKQAGFSSRTTFFNTIKRNTGLSPSEFAAQIKTDEG